jgi:hypothetical protein
MAAKARRICIRIAETGQALFAGFFPVDRLPVEKAVLSAFRATI